MNDEESSRLTWYFEHYKKTVHTKRWNEPKPPETR